MNDGGPAFPLYFDYDKENADGTNGMSLRDYFAAKAMSQCIALCMTNDGCVDFVAAAKAAYDYADATLAERGKEKA